MYAHGAHGGRKTWLFLVVLLAVVASAGQGVQAKKKDKAAKRERAAAAERAAETPTVMPPSEPDPTPAVRPTIEPLVHGAPVSQPRVPGPAAKTTADDTADDEADDDDDPREAAPSPLTDLLSGKAAKRKAKKALKSGENYSEMRRFFTSREVLRGWRDFADLWLMLDMILIITMAVTLGAIIAYHPLTRAKASTIDELEQPKTFIMYSMVGAVISMIVTVYPVMAGVIFGIGGLLRFRTNVGPAKDTGRVILATVVGLCCGLKLIVAAVFATAFGWIIIWYLEKQVVGRLMIKGLNTDLTASAAEAYRAILLRVGCKILGEKKKVEKGQIIFVLHAPQELDREWLDSYIQQNLPEQLRGTLDWEVS